MPAVFTMRTFLITTCLFLMLCSCDTRPPKEPQVKAATGIVMPDTAKPVRIVSPSCGTIVLEILLTSPRYLQLTDGLYEAVVKNGGTSFGINYEGSPDPEADSAMSYSETYDYSVHETYPDHNPVRARFTFDTRQRQLYEHDAVEDTLIPVSFNRQLLGRLDSFCH